MLTRPIRKLTLGKKTSQEWGRGLFPRPRKGPDSYSPLYPRPQGAVVDVFVSRSHVLSLLLVDSLIALIVLALLGALAKPKKSKQLTNQRTTQTRQMLGTPKKVTCLSCSLVLFTCSSALKCIVFIFLRTV